MKRILSLLKRDAVLTAAWTLAVLSMAAVPPSIRYIGYLDLHTLGLLFCLMVTMAGLQAIGFFHRLGESLLMRIKSLLVKKKPSRKVLSGGQDVFFEEITFWQPSSRRCAGA